MDKAHCLDAKLGLLISLVREPEFLHSPQGIEAGVLLHRCSELFAGHASSSVVSQP